MTAATIDLSGFNSCYQNFAPLSIKNRSQELKRQEFKERVLKVVLTALFAVAAAAAVVAQTALTAGLCASFFYTFAIPLVSNLLLESVLIPLFCQKIYNPSTKKQEELLKEAKNLESIHQKAGETAKDEEKLKNSFRGMLSSPAADQAIEQIENEGYEFKKVAAGPLAALTHTADEINENQKIFNRDKETLNNTTGDQERALYSIDSRKKGLIDKKIQTVVFATHLAYPKEDVGKYLDLQHINQHTLYTLTLMYLSDIENPEVLKKHETMVSLQDPNNPEESRQSFLTIREILNAPVKQLIQKTVRAVSPYLQQTENQKVA